MTREPIRDIDPELLAGMTEVYRTRGAQAATEFIRSYGIDIDIGSVRSRMKYRGIRAGHSQHYRPWSIDEVAYLNSTYADPAVPVSTILAKLDRPYEAIKDKARTLGLTRRNFAPGSIVPRVTIPHLEVTRPLLVLADIHVPFQNHEWIDDIIELATTWGATDVLLAGDAIDAASVSKFEKRPSTPSIPDEIREWGRFEEYLLTHFRQVHWILGNHEARLGKSMDWAIPVSELVAGQFVKDRGRVRVYDSYAVQVNTDWRIEHPKSHGRMAAVNLTITHHMNVAIAHTHHADVQRDPSGKYHAIRIGAAADHTRMDYCTRITHGKDAMTNGALILVPRGEDDSLHAYNLEPGNDLTRLARLYGPDDWGEQD